MAKRRRPLTDLLGAGLLCVAMLPAACAPTTPVRLGRAVVPVFQEIALNVDAGRDDYTGSVAIELDVRRQTDSIRFHAREMDLRAVALEKGRRTAILTFTVGEKGLVTARDGTPVKPGRYTLRIEFATRFNRKGTGMYKTKYDGASYVYTQFEPEFARMAFPCWDEPGFKINWAMSLTVPKDHLAVSNTPIERVTQSGQSKTLYFMRTKPMPSYLLAVAAGPMEALGVEGMSVPGRIITPRGRKHLAGMARQISPKLLKALEEYFESPYPYRKLDQIAVPEFNFGAMENVGAITYRDSILLKDPKTATASQRQRQASVVAHEMAHMWFGNLVTPKWWDDLWLNESFASWMALKIVRRVHPEFRTSNRDIASRVRAMGEDSLATARAIRRKVPAGEDMTRLFNAMAYAKGMAILTMVEDWLGEEAFRKGMVHYMREHRWGNADAFDLAAALATVDDSDINAIVKDFITQPGVPLVRVEFVDDATVKLTQKRFSLYGVKPKRGQRWTIPIILRYSDGSKEYTQKVLLTDSAATVRLKVPVRGRDGAWLYPNADEKGYYRWIMAASEMAPLARIARSEFDTRRRLGFLDNVTALFYAGRIPVDGFLTVVSSFNLDASPEVVEKVIEALDGIYVALIGDDLKKPYAAYVRTVLQPALEKIGVNRIEGEGVLVGSLRSHLVAALGEKGRDSRLLKLARTRTAAYIKDPYSVDPDLAGVFLRLAAIGGGAELFATYTRKLETVKDPTARSNYLDALGCFRRPDMMPRVLAYALNGPVKPREVDDIIFELAWDETSRRKVLDWVFANYAAITKTIPEQSMHYLPWLADGRSRELLDRARTFFLDRKRRTDGMADEFRELTDIIDLRIKLSRKERGRLTSLLERRMSKPDSVPGIEAK